MTHFILGIAGASGSGKSYLANLLLTKFSQNCIVINQDNYYLSFDKLSSKERSKLNFDHPFIIDWKLLKKHLLSLKSGKSIKTPRYSFSRHLRLKQTRIIQPKPLIIFEGIFALYEEIRPLLSYTIFLDTDKEMCFQRRLKRDIHERGRKEKDVINQYNSTVNPGFKEHIFPTKDYADLSIKDNNYLELFQQLRLIVQADKYNL